jgi:hypothetical protein
MGAEGINEHTVGPWIQIEMARWFESRKASQQGPHPKLVALMPLMFRTLDALYLETRKLPIVGISGVKWKKPKDKPDVFTLGLNLEASEYVTLRSILALAGDLKLVLYRLKDLRQPSDVGQFIQPLHEHAKKFEDVRNFFTHMDDGLRNYSTFSNPVPYKLDCGVRFTYKATNNNCVIWENGTLYFSYYKKPCQVDIDKPEFNEIFNLARELYRTIIQNPISQKSREFRDPDQVYPLN